MKKFYVVLASVLCLASMNAADYKHSIGVEVGGLNGASYKGFIFKSQPNLALQADLAVGVFAIGERVPVGGMYTWGAWDFTANPNLIYQGEIGKGFDWFAGGGMSLGMMDAINGHSLFGKYGVNALAGVEYKVQSAPVTIGMDFRPGYGLEFGKNTSYSFFDWKLALSVRYCF